MTAYLVDSVGEHSAPTLPRASAILASHSSELVQYDVTKPVFTPPGTTVDAGHIAPSKDRVGLQFAGSLSWHNIYYSGSVVWHPPPSKRQGSRFGVDPPALELISPAVNPAQNMCGY